MTYNKQNDPYRYVKAEDFFSSIDTRRLQYDRVEGVALLPESEDPQRNVTHHGRAFRTTDHNGIVFLIEFIRPTVFRIRFNPERTRLDQYTDWNSRNIVQDTMGGLIAMLDQYEGYSWEVTFTEDADFIVLESRDVNQPPPANQYYMRIYVRKKPFQVIVTRPLPRHFTNEEQRFVDQGLLPPDNTEDVKIVWQCKPEGIIYSAANMMTVIETEKPGRARYLGFGEQGGRQLLKTKTIVDYFNYDNMRYMQVYGRGPLDSREPLYHSEPFWMQVAQHPGHSLRVASFVDNFSQVCLDIGSKDNGALRVAARFNSMQLYIITGTSPSEIIRLYTAIVGRPTLKPRYVLGHHQGCYGYDKPDKIWGVVNRYRQEGFPLDGMHIDVDFQNSYETFTVNQQVFQDPGAFLRDLRQQGVKCSTNITPFINGDNDPNYDTLQQGLARNYFVKDKRHHSEGGPVSANEDRYMLFRGGFLNEFEASDLGQEPRPMYRPPDNIPLAATWDTGKDFRGGVWYGGALGKPGHYPDLNRRDVRSWWGEQYNNLIQWGLEFVWQDMTSPCMGASYGDMRSFPFRLLLTSDMTKDTKRVPEANTISTVPAIKIWSLYAFNLHKATYKGWNQHPARRGKRNFIIGRGGAIGLHRYAGLWTGDNASQWDFLKISVSQVLSLGLSGITISGGDVGGFEPATDGEQWASPELLMRWYCAYSLLPWFRNHYNGKDNKKSFQEPYAFGDVLNRDNNIPVSERWMYGQTLPVCLYYVKLRYTLLQLLYDQMFDNLITGLPIARSLMISNEDDASLVVENADYLDDEYMVGDDLLVAPILHPQGDGTITRTVYLPRPSSWWQCNLRADGPDQAVRLESNHKFNGGSLIDYDARLNVAAIPYVTPMFVKFNAIIPQIEPRMYAEDWSSQGNPISIHFYPGSLGGSRFRSYDMYLDDGVSRSSAPTPGNLQWNLSVNQEQPPPTNLLSDHLFGDTEANNEYWKVRIDQRIGEGPSGGIVRTIRLRTLHYHNNFDPTTTFGRRYRLFVWGEPDRIPQFSQATVPPPVLPNSDARATPRYDNGKNAWIIDVDIGNVHSAKYDVQCTVTY